MSNEDDLSIMEQVRLDPAFKEYFTDSQDVMPTYDYIKKVAYVKSPQLKFDHDLIKVPLQDLSELCENDLYMMIEESTNEKTKVLKNMMFRFGGN